EPSVGARVAGTTRYRRASPWRIDAAMYHKTACNNTGEGVVYGGSVAPPTYAPPWRVFHHLVAHMTHTLTPGCAAAAGSQRCRGRGGTPRASAQRLVEATPSPWQVAIQLSLSRLTSGVHVGAADRKSV